jgi:hypothetical protein
VKVGDLVRVDKQERGVDMVGKRGLITKIIEYTRYTPDMNDPVTCAIVLISTRMVIIPLDFLTSVKNPYV